ncbi:MAG: ribosome recycling factor [Malacoplasma sp.]
MEWNVYKNEFENQSNPKINWLVMEYQKLKTGRPNPHIFDSITIECYGDKLKLLEVSNIQIVEGKQIIIKPYDKTLCSAINAAILKSNLGITPQLDADLIRVNFPPQTEENRKLSIKKAKELSEECKISIRNIRKNIHNQFKSNKELSKDLISYFEEELDKMTKNYNNEIESIFSAKEKELLTI